MRRGKLRSDGSFSLWLTQSFAQLPIREAPFTFSIASAAADIELPQSDIGDVYLAATAFTNELTLVTNDAQLLVSLQVAQDSVERLTMESAQFSTGVLLALSITITSTGPFAPSSLSPSCC